MSSLTSALVSFLLCAAPLSASGQGDRPQAVAAVERAFQQWRAAHGAQWRAEVDPRTGRIRSLFGGARAADSLPASDADWIDLAARRVAEVEPMLGIALDSLEPAEVTSLDLVRIGTSDKTVVRFRQAPGGVPVEGGTVSVILGMDAELLCVASTALPDASGIPLAPVASELDALDLAQREFLRAEGVPATAKDDLALVVAADLRGGMRRARLAWAVGLSAEASAGDLPHSRRVLVAADVFFGEVLSSRSRVHRAAQIVPQPIAQGANGPAAPAVKHSGAALEGYVRAFATPGLEADWSGNPPEAQPLSGMLVTSSQGNAVTASNGGFAIPYAGSASALVTLGYQGPWVNVNNAGGADTSATVSVTPGAPGFWKLNLPPTEFGTAEANAFVQVNRFRDYVHGLAPGDTTMDFQAIANVNQSSTCGAYYNGTSVNFFRQGFCRNTSYSTVVAHEMGHWANDRYGSGNGPDGFGEGAADAWAMYIHDTPLIGEEFLPGSPIRDGENLRQYCGDGNGGCHGSPHADGEVLMGALWKVRRNLNGSLGDGLGDRTADVLFLSWMQAFDDGEIDSLIETHWLVLDDDDADLSNGTPHHAEIDAAFAEQGFPGFP